MLFPPVTVHYVSLIELSTLPTYDLALAYVLIFSFAISAVEIIEAHWNTFSNVLLLIDSNDVSIFCSMRLNCLKSLIVWCLLYFVLSIHLVGNTCIWCPLAYRLRCC